MANTWTNYAGDVWWTGYTDPEIVCLKESGTSLTRYYDKDDLSANPGSYFHDLVNKRLYIHATNSTEIKGNAKTYLAEFWVGITNVQDTDYPAIYKPFAGEPLENKAPIEYYPFLDAKSRASVTMNVGEQYQDVITMQFGSINLTDATFWYPKKNDWIFLNRPFYVKIGEIDTEYAQMEKVFAGKLEEPEYSDAGIKINTRDMRMGVLQSIPPEVFETAKNPDIESGKQETPVPILFGIKQGIKPVKIGVWDTTNQWLAQVTPPVYGGDFELWQDASTPRLWKTIEAGTSTVNRDSSTKRSGSYSCRLDIDASNSQARIRTLTDTSEKWYDVRQGIWLNPGIAHNLRFYYRNSASGKTAKYFIGALIGTVWHYWDKTNSEWKSGPIYGVTYNLLPNALGTWSLEDCQFYIPRIVDAYTSDAIDPGVCIISIREDSAASSSINIDDLEIYQLPTYKITQTVFNGELEHCIPMQSVDNVYLAGVEIFSPGDYGEYLDEGIIYLKSNPGADAENITVNAQGLKVQHDFSTGSRISPMAFSENVADILFFVLHILNVIPTEEMDLPAFEALQETRTQRMGWYLTNLQETIEFVKLLQRSAIFHYLITVDGKHTAKFYDRTVPDDTKVLQNPDYLKYSYKPGTKSVFEKIVLLYDKNPMDDEFSVFQIMEPSVGHLYGEKRTLGGDGIITALVDESEAEAVGQFYIALTENPPAKIDISTLTPSLFDLIPTDKVIVNRSVLNEKNETITIHDEEVYSIISHRRHLNKNSSDLKLGLDSALAGLRIHGDSPYGDHTDNHSDHTDEAHVDTPHGDTAHIDHDDHIDLAYEDDYADTYEDVPHDDHSDYLDHTDTIAPHEDQTVHVDDHTDNTYDDHTDNIYNDYDDYDDFHTDDAHLDGYEDYTDHLDSHADTPHADSEI